MSIRRAGTSPALGVALGLLLIAGGLNGQWHEQKRYSDFHRFFISLGGGYGFSEGGQGMVDLKAELQFSFTSRIRLGLGVGYMRGEGGHNWITERNDWGNGMMTNQSEQDMSHASNDRDNPKRGYGPDFHIVPLSLNLYYILPLAHRWDVFMNGGGSLYFGSFYGIVGPRHKNIWGGQAGLGTEYRLTRSIRLIAEGGYRFAEFGRLKRLIPLNPVPLMGSEGETSGSPMDGVQRFRMVLSGFSLRAGVRFGL
jgi:hypothetical protein